MRTLSSLCLFFLATSAIANEIRIPEKYNVGGFIAASPNKAYKFEAHDSPRLLQNATDEDLKIRRNARAAKGAAAYMKTYPGTTGLLLIDRGKVVFQGFQGMGGPEAEYFGMSISKSLASLAVGKAVCAGHLKSLDQLAGDLIPELKINNLGKSSVRQLLTMSSGAYLNHLSGQPKVAGGVGKRPRNGKPFIATTWPIRLGQISMNDMLWGDVWARIENKNYHAPGERFIYKAADTMSLSKIVEKATGISLAAYFDRTIWQQVQPAKGAHWEHDRDGSTVGMSGFQATLSDWGRFAVWVLEQHTAPGCFGDYVRAATSTQITANAFNNGFQGYGYQWWTEHKSLPGFWGRGFAGQALAINAKSGKVLIKFGYRVYKGVSADLNKIYRRWHR